MASQLVRLVFAALLSASIAFAEKTVRGSIMGLDGRLLESGTLTIGWFCEGCDEPEPVQVGVAGKFSFRNLDPFAHTGILTLAYMGRTYVVERQISPADNVPLELSLQLTEEFSTTYYRMIEIGPEGQILNRKVSTVFPSGNLILNSSLESESHLFAGSATSGWVGYWGATILRERSSTAQFGNWVLKATTTADNTPGQFQGAEYIISEEDPAFRAIEKANAEGKPMTISAWVRAGTSALGKSVVFDDIFHQGNDAAHTFSDDHWHKISYTFSGILIHPNTFAFRHFGFSIHEQTPSASAFNFEIDNVMLTVGGILEQAPSMTSIDLTDGAAKILQSLALREAGSSAMSRVVTRTDFDSIGRPSKTWLPFEESCSGSGCMRLSTSNPNTHYQGSTNGLPNAGGFAYSLPIYENEPLPRTFQATRPGVLYQPALGHLAKISYSATANLSETSLGANRADPVNIDNPAYSYVHNRDPNGHETMLWKDANGNPVKSTAYDPGRTGFVATQTVFDDRGLPIRTLPPISCKDASGAATPSHNCVEPREMVYNQSKLLIQEKSPDYGTVKSIYNVAGQLKASQTQAQSDRDEFTIFKYSSWGQLIEKGLMKGDLEQVANPHFFDNMVVGSQLIANPQLLVFTYLEDAYLAATSKVLQGSRTLPLTIYVATFIPDEEVSPPEGFEFEPLTDANGNRAGIDLVGIEYGSEQFNEIMRERNQGLVRQGIEDPNWPYAGTYQTLVRYVYDSETNLPEDVKISGIPFIIPTGETAGFAKGKLVASINYNPHLAFKWPALRDRVVATFSKYDDNGSVVNDFKYIGTVSDADRRIQEIDYTFDQSNRLLTKTVWKNVDGADREDMSSFHRFTYDEAGRLGKVFTNQKTDCNQEMQIVSHVYLPDGKVGQILLGNPADGVSVLYSYHLHGMVKNITVRQVTCSSTGVCNPTTIYSEDLRYDEELDSDIAEPQFNGNISQMLYYLGQKSEHRAYAYIYDGVNRLIRSYYTADGSNANYLDEEESYLADGRIKAMKRGNVTQTQEQPYRYNSGTNQLRCVEEAIDNDPDLQKSRTCSGQDGSIPRYSYDSDGNLSKSLVDGETTIEYDWRNLPWKFTKGTDQFIMVYDEGGNRVSKIQVPTSAGSTQTLISAKHYLPGEKEIREFPGENNDIETIEFANLWGLGLIGRVSEDRDKEFYIKNHLGSLVTKFSDGGGWLSESMYDYFSFGKQVKITQDSKPPVTEAFTGKELDEELGFYYFGHRYYDADLGLWISPDPARQFHSPYAYGPGDPVNGNDPDGAVWRTTNVDGGNGFGSGLFNAFQIFSRVKGPIGQRGETNYFGGLRADKFKNLTTQKVTQTWFHDPNDPDAVNHLHPSGTTRQFSQTMEPMDKVLRVLKDIENTNSFLYGGKSAWYPPIPNLTYWEMADAPHSLNGQSISPSTPSNPNVEIGPVDVCSGCPWTD